eukprot:CAMPEP_0204340150 /NCGR_PEP_ID=MMETSP0469-20131031/22361_1 /ASSEMBLY_ACC=CAM_ASM_000384 /TAXON_ID=2969 /ORGANISM="Oxyrrhis marina" /LENGTH=297 /DNA_ID=CAMNT_0051324633 /DNA_START=1 /DNA_END=894 /DNA_ORIENTATION=+
MLTPKWMRRLFVVTAPPLSFVAGTGVFAWVNRDDESREFVLKHGQPTEEFRLEFFKENALLWDTNNELMEDAIKGIRHRMLMEKVQGHVLEVAAGTCMNFPYYSKRVKSLTVLDRVEEMLAMGQKKVDSVRYPVQAVVGEMTKLPFEDGTFDCVVGTLCVCSAEHPKKALKEMARVCRPNSGRIVLIEIGESSWTIVNAVSEYFMLGNPKHAWDCGSYDDRRIAELVQDAGLMIRAHRTARKGRFHLIVASPKWTDAVDAPEESEAMPKLKGDGTIFFSHTPAEPDVQVEAGQAAQG